MDSLNLLWWSGVRLNALEALQGPVLLSGVLGEARGRGSVGMALGGRWAGVEGGLGEDPTLAWVQVIQTPHLMDAETEAAQ